MFILEWMQQIRNPVLDVFFKVASMLAEPMVSIVVIAVFFYFIDKNFAYRIGFAMTFGLMLNGFLKPLFAIKRPWMINPKLSPVGGAHGADTSFSFPSGHTQNAVALYGSFAIYLKHILFKVLPILIIILVALSRMYLGVHTLWDVSTSILINLFLLLLVYKLPLDRHNKKRDISMVSAILLAVLVLCIVIRFKPYADGYEFEVVKDSFSAAGILFGLLPSWLFEKYAVGYRSAPGIFKKVLTLLIGFAGAGLILVGSEMLLQIMSVPAEITQGVKYMLPIWWAFGLCPLIVKKSIGKDN